MALRITIDIFSGRPNPVIEIAGKQAREVLERIKPVKPLNKRAMPVPEFRMGYRGLIIEQSGATRARPAVVRVAAGAIHGPGLAHTIADAEFEDFFRRAQGAGREAQGRARFTSPPAKGDQTAEAGSRDRQTAEFSSAHPTTVSVRPVV